ncbi:hypothetical protein ZWY2020_047253 [Hordeum vulgare]|nr:hypothetical protein ZWY2020_047253 [Hordeum vulgare]
MAEIGKIHSQIHEALRRRDDTRSKEAQQVGEALTMIIGLICILVWLIKVKSSNFVSWARLASPRKCYVDITASKTKHRIELPKRYLNDLAGGPTPRHPDPEPALHVVVYKSRVAERAAPPARAPPMSATSSTSSMDDQPLLPLARGDYRLFVFL